MLFTVLLNPFPQLDVIVCQGPEVVIVLHQIDGAGIATMLT